MDTKRKRRKKTRIEINPVEYEPTETKSNCTLKDLDTDKYDWNR